MREAQALDLAAASLVRAGCPAAFHDARLLLRDVLDEYPAAVATAALPPNAVDKLMNAVAARADRRPLAYVRGRASFRGLDMTVDDRVFVPRPETELLVESALDIPLGARVLEPCTGSGAVAVALAVERPDLDITASDVSGDALAIAQENAVRHQARVRFFCADGIAAVPGDEFDAVVCNPPYVAETDRGTGALPPELERHEPGQAFWAGTHGLDLYPRLVGQLADSVRWAAFEVGDGQDPAVERLLAGRGLAVRTRCRTAAGAVRVVVAVR